MATEDAFINAGRGIGSRPHSSQLITLTVAGNTTVKGIAVLPAGSWYRLTKIETPTAISGTPTTCNVRVGTTDTGQEIVADVDAKAQGHISGTMVAGFDAVGACAAADTTIYAQVVTSGGTNAAGTIYILVDYQPPVR